MTDFVFNPKINDPFAQITETALGNGSPLWTDKEVGKAVKLAAGSSHVLCADGDEIEGVVVSIEPFTVNGGVSFGTIQKDRRMLAVVGATAVTLGGTVVSGVQIALGTQAGVGPVVKGAAITATSKFVWRCIRIVTGTGATAGDIVLIERV